MDMIKFDPFYIFTMMAGLIIWFTRLESKTNRNEKDIEKMSKKHDTLESELIRDLSEVKQALARIEGSMNIKEK